MKPYRLVGIIVVLLLCALSVGCQLEHSHFEFVVDEFEGLDKSEYLASEDLTEYKIMGIVIRPWIKETPHDVYGLRIYGYANESAENMKMQINSILLYTDSGTELIAAPEYNTQIAYSSDEIGGRYIADDVGSFTGDVQTIKNYDILHLKIEVEVTDGENTEIKELLYEIDIVEYLTSFMIT